MGTLLTPDKNDVDKNMLEGVKIFCPDSATNCKFREHVKKYGNSYLSIDYTSPYPIVASKSAVNCIDRTIALQIMALAYVRSMETRCIHQKSAKICHC